jgi:carbonic anhydrase
MLRATSVDWTSTNKAARDHFNVDLCELNVIEQVLNVCRSTMVQEAWARGQQLSVRGWVYSLTDGLIRDLQMSVAKPGEASEAFQGALAALPTRAFG